MLKASVSPAQLRLWRLLRLYGAARVINMAERVGFEPTRGLRPLRAFQARLFDHSSTSPRSKDAAGRACLRYGSIPTTLNHSV